MFLSLDDLPYTTRIFDLSLDGGSSVKKNHLKDKC